MQSDYDDPTHAAVSIPQKDTTAQAVEDILHLGQQIKKLVCQCCTPLTEQTGLRAIELEILYFLVCAQRHGNGDTARDIAGAKGLSKAHISKSIDNLYHGGYIELSEDASDHRRVHLRPTAKAQPVAAAYDHAIQQTLRGLLQGVSEQEYRTLHILGSKLTNNLRRMQNTTP